MDLDRFNVIKETLLSPKPSKRHRGRRIRAIQGLAELDTNTRADRISVRKLLSRVYRTDPDPAVRREARAAWTRREKQDHISIKASILGKLLNEPS
jgi:hypothetical protein